MGKRSGLVAAAVLMAALILLIWWTLGTPPPTDELTFEEEAPIEAPSSSDGLAEHASLQPEPESVGERLAQVVGEVTVSPEAHEPSQERTSRIQGRVTDEHDTPIAEAVVTLVSGIAYDEPILLTQTDFDGRFELVYSPLHPLFNQASTDQLLGRLVVEAHGYARATRLVAMGQFDFELRPAGAIAGHVVWEGGEPVAGAEVTAATHMALEDARAWSAQTTISGAIADGVGQFRLENLAPGEVAIAAAPPGEPPFPAGTFTVGSEEVTLTLTSQIGVVTGRVLGAVTEEPLEDTDVHLGGHAYALSPFPDDAWTVMTDREGTFRFEEIPMGIWLIRVPGFETVRGRADLTSENPERSVTLWIPEPVPVAGEVVLVETGEPVPDLPLEFGIPPSGRIARTDDDGRFDLGEVPVSVYDQADQRMFNLMVETVEPGFHFVPGANYHWMSVREFSELAEMRIEVEPGLPLRVTAVDPDGHPVGPTWLFAMSSPVGTSGRDIGTTDAQGFLATSRQESLGAVRVFGRHPTHPFGTGSRSGTRWPLMVSPIVSPETTETVVTALPTTSLTVRVVDAEGHPVPNMAVRVDPQMPPMVHAMLGGWFSLDSSDPTDAVGEVEFDVVARCPQLVRATRPRSNVWETWQRSRNQPSARIDLTDAEEPAEVTITLEDMTLSGNVIDGYSYDPVEGARVFWLTEESTDRGVTSGADGAFTISGDAGVAASGLGASADGYMTRRMPNPPARDIVLAFQPEYIFRGRVLRPSGAAPPTTRVILFIPSGYRPGWAFMGASLGGGGDTQPDGSFEERPQSFAFANAETEGPVWLLICTQDGEFATGDHWMDLTVRQDVDFGTMTLRPCASLSGRVLDRDGEPIEGAGVSWEAASVILEDPYYVNVLPVGSTWAVRSDAEGAYALSRLPSGVWRIHIEAEGYPLHTFEVELEGDIARDFTLEEEPEGATQLTVHLLNEDGEPMWAPVRVMDEALEPVTVSRVEDETGAYRASGLTPGPHFVHITIHRSEKFFEWQRAPVHVPPEGREETIDLSTWSILTGLVDRGGEEPGRVYVNVRGAVSDLSVAGVNANQLTSTAGSFEIRLPPGVYELTLDHDSTHPVDLSTSRELRFDLAGTE
jgi:Carboxypeptidase regulatory-like domain